MGKLINIAKPAIAGDPCELWRTVADLIDALNDITVTIVEVQSGNYAEITEGDIQLNLNFLTPEDAKNSIPGYAPPGSSVEDTSGAFDGATADGSAGGDGGGD